MTAFRQFSACRECVSPTAGSDHPDYERLVRSVRERTRSRARLTSVAVGTRQPSCVRIPAVTRPATMTANKNPYIPASLLPRGARRNPAFP